MASTKFSIFSSAAKSVPPAQTILESKPKLRQPPPEPAFVLHKQTQPIYSAVNRLSRSSSSASSESESSGSSPSLSNLIDSSDGPEKVRQWAQAVAYSVREASPTKLAGDLK